MVRGDALMAGRGPAPKAERYRRGTPGRGDWTPSPDGGWQHDLPPAPTGITPGSAAVWESWFRAWWAGNWTPDDLPTLRFVIRLYDRVMRGDVRRAAELRQWLDSYGITPKGQQDRRWARPLPPRPMTPLERIRAEAYAKRDQRTSGQSARDRLAVLGDQESAKARFKRIAAEVERRSDPHHATDPDD